MIKQGYPALYALLLTLALGVGCALIARLLHRGPDDPDGDPKDEPRWA